MSTSPHPSAPPADQQRLGAEQQRLLEISDDISGWRKWGPYLSDRAWGTVREDYSPTGDAWNYLPHELARSKAFRWGEDGIAGICDRYQLLCLSLAFWNGRDRMLKERFFGVTPAEGNHGEDVKEYYFYLDNTPTHSYMRMLYKYPQAAYPYEQLVAENQARGGQGFEYELLDTGVFDRDRYFDIFVEYAKADADDLCARIEVFNRGPEAASLHIIPQLWFRNTWSWWNPALPEPAIRPGASQNAVQTLVATECAGSRPPTIPDAYRLGTRVLYAPAAGAPMFTDNETHAGRVFGPGHFSRSPYVKDAFHRSVVDGESCLKPSGGTKAGLHFTYPQIPAGGSIVLRLRLCGSTELSEPLRDVDTIVAQRKREADEFYASIAPLRATADERNVQRQAFAGLLWSKQNYIFDVDAWLTGDNPEYPPPASRRHVRNTHWRHLNSLRVLSMPDKWEYPWFAAWDLAFHAVTLALVDARFAKDQLAFMLYEQFQHPNGQIPAYEWEFSDLNPPVHAWAVWRVYHMDRLRSGVADLDFLESCFHKLLINFAWWVNRVDREGNNLFEGGFLGLDNISVVDRSQRLPEGATLNQADGTGWMGMFCLYLMQIALELAEKRGSDVYEGLASKFFQHYAMIASAMKHMGARDFQLWDETDGFFYDVLTYPDGRSRKFRVRSLVGLIPLFAVARLDERWIGQFKLFQRDLNWHMKHRSERFSATVHRHARGGETTYVLSIVDPHQLRGMLRRVCDADEFFSDFGIRSLSKIHEREPFHFDEASVVGYEPAEAVSKIKGGNSNWRGPIWFPANFLLIETFRKLAKAYGDEFSFASPDSTGPGTFPELARETANRLIRIFTRNEQGERPVYGPGDGVSARFQHDPHWRDHVLFFEYFHGDNGAGLGASHQTGWTALVASLIDEWRR